MLICLILSRDQDAIFWFVPLLDQTPKKIKGKTILDQISFEVGQGDCLALIGPNGAGKTTLMSCILGDKKASSGQVFIKGKKGKAQDQIAVLLQENTIPSQLRVKELIAFSRYF